MGAYFCDDGSSGFCSCVGIDVLVDGETSHDLVEVSDRHFGRVDVGRIMSFSPGDGFGGCDGGDVHN